MELVLIVLMVAASIGLSACGIYATLSVVLLGMQPAASRARGPAFFVVAAPATVASQVR